MTFQLPSELAERIASRIGEIEEVSSFGHGSIGPIARIRAGGVSWLVKYSDGGKPGIFTAEARGLNALRRSGSSLRIPAVLDVHDVDVPGTNLPSEGVGSPDSADDVLHGELPGTVGGPRVVREAADLRQGGAWIVLEWLDVITSPGPADWTALGQGLAALHRSTHGAWGWEADGYIAALPQVNTLSESWADFWRDHRLRPQLERARSVPGIGDPDDWRRLKDALPEILSLAAEDGPSLLHGDLWSGNVLMTASAPALIDPTVYRGHREVDLAMADLFGGFDPRFRAAYEEAWPLQPGYEVRRSVYQLYYLLVHVNLFGASYAGRTRRTLLDALRRA